MGYHLHAQALASGGRQDSRAIHRTVFSNNTQQPLGGEGAIRDWPRFAKMEVWAWKPTVARRTFSRNCSRRNRDDVYGRAKIYEAIVKGEPGIEPGVP